MLLPCVRSTLGSVRCLFIILSNGFIAFFPLHFPVFSGTLSSDTACLSNCRGGGGDDGWWGRLRRPMSLHVLMPGCRAVCAALCSSERTSSMTGHKCPDHSDTPSLRPTCPNHPKHA